MTPRSPGLPAARTRLTLKRLVVPVLACLASSAGAVAAHPPFQTPARLPPPFASPALTPVAPRAERAAYARFDRVRWTAIRYRAHNGETRRAIVIAPRRYSRARDGTLPLILSPHGRGVGAWQTAHIWGNLPAIGRFAVVCPEGQGRRLTLYSWGDVGEIADLARMPAIVEKQAAWLHIDPRRIYAFGGSMGGQETLLLIAQYPALLAGGASFDADTNLVSRFRAFPGLRYGLGLQRLAVAEVGGYPWTDPRAWAIRSPIDWARQIAFSGVPLQIWWSTRDQIVRDQASESGALFRAIERLNPRAPVVQFVGGWRHTAEFWAARRLPFALALFGLLPRPGNGPAG